MIEVKGKVIRYFFFSGLRNEFVTAPVLESADVIQASQCHSEFKYAELDAEMSNVI